MNTTAALVLAITLAGLSAPAAATDLNTDICRQLASKASGSSGPLFAGQVGKFTFRLSGSASIGVSRSSGPPISSKVPAFAGQAASERRAEKALERYQRSYDDCMSSH